MSAEDVARRFCAAPPAEAQVKAGDSPDEEIDVRVPSDDAPYAWSSPTIAVRLGDVVRLSVFSDQTGAAGVHGLSTIDPVHQGETVAIKFRAVYSGRFPLHFHGTGGSHFELMVLNVTADPVAQADN